MMKAGDGHVLKMNRGTKRDSTDNTADVNAIVA